MPERHFVWNGLSHSGWWFACGLAAAVLILLLYRTERKLVPAGTGYLLLTLRLAVVGVLLFTLLEPVLTWTFENRTSGKVVVALDLSESMGVTDPHALQAEKLRWARALGMIGNPAISSRLDGWIAALEEGKEPQWVDAAETVDPQKRARLEQSRKDNLQAVFAEVDKLPRKEIARRLLTGTNSPLLPQLEKVGKVELTVFGGRALGTDERSLEKIVNRPPLEVTTATTDLVQGLRATPDDSQTRIIGIVLLSDGRDNTQRDPTGAARRLGQLQVPVFSVALGTTNRPRDIAFRHLDYPETVFKNDKPVLKAVLNTSGFSGQELDITLERPDQPALTRKIQVLSEETPIEFELDGTELGRKEYKLTTPVRPGETRKDNNEAAFAMTVVDDKVHVLLIEGEARWEFRFIDACLRRDKRVELKDVVFDQPYIGLLPEGYFSKSLALPDAPAADVNLQETPFSQPDLVIIGDVSARHIPPRGWDVIDKFVSEAGGTLVLCGGKNSFPLEHNSPALQQMLPITDLRSTEVPGANPFGAPNERGFTLRLTPEGEREPMLQFDVDPLENRRIWAELPGHTWALFGEAKPGATVYAAAAIPGQNNPLEAERKGAILVHQHYGVGQVLWIGIDSTWRWRHRVGDKYHHRFWGQLARWAATNKASVGNEFVKFGPEKADVDEGQDVLLRARFVLPFLRRFPELKASAEIIPHAGPEGGVIATIPLKPSVGREHIFEGKTGSLPFGEYKVRLKVEGADVGPRPIEAPLTVHRKRSLELADLTANVDLLRQLAGSSGGEFLLPDQLSRIPERLKPPESQSVDRREVSLWDSWMVLVLFFGLLTTEWVVRKLNGLP